MHRSGLSTIAVFAGVLGLGAAAVSQCNPAVSDLVLTQRSGCAAAVSTTSTTSTTAPVTTTTTTVAGPPTPGSASEEMVSVTPSGAPATYTDAYGGGRGAMTADGRYVVFSSTATDLVAGDTNGLLDVFVRDRDAGTTERVSLKSDGSEITAADVSAGPSAYAHEAAYAHGISADGRYVLLETAARLVSCDTDTGIDLYRLDRQTHTLALVSMTWQGFGSGSTWIGRASMSADGRYVAFDSDSPYMVPNDPDTSGLWDDGLGNTIRLWKDGWAPDVFVRDMASGTTTFVSVGPNQTVAAGFDPDITPDGRYVVFSAQNMVATPTNNEVMRYDRNTGNSALVGLDAAGRPAEASWPTISADGNVVVFSHPTGNINAVTTLTPDAQLDGSGTDLHLYARNLSAGTTVLVDSNVPLFTTDREPMSSASVSADGRYVAFDCFCQRVYSGPNPGMNHQGVYRADLATGAVIEADVNADGAVANGDSYVATQGGPTGITADGSSMLIGSAGDNLVTGDVNNRADVFVSTPH